MPSAGLGPGVLFTDATGGYGGVPLIDFLEPASAIALVLQQGPEGAPAGGMLSKQRSKGSTDCRNHIMKTT